MYSVAMPPCNVSVRFLQVLSQLPSLHQLNLRGCPVADHPDYQMQLMQQLPMLDVLDSKKIAKSGLPRVAKPPIAAASAAVAKQTKKTSIDSGHDRDETLSKGTESKLREADSRAAGKQALPQGKKRKLQAEAGSRDDVVAKKVHKVRKRALSSDSEALLAPSAGQEQPAPKALQQQVADSDDADTLLSQDRPKPGKKHKSKGQTQSTDNANSRSFLADVLNPVEPQPVAQPIAPRGHDHGRAATADPAAKPAAAASSGLVKVIEAAPGKKPKGKHSKHGKGSSGKSEKQPASEASGSSAAQLLQSGLGLDALQVGLGGGTAWQ